MDQKSLEIEMTNDDVLSFKKYYKERAYLSIIPIFVGLIFAIVGKTFGLIIGVIILFPVVMKIWKTYKLYRLELKNKQKIVGLFKVTNKKKGTRRYKTNVNINCEGKDITIYFPKFFENKEGFEVGDWINCELTKVLHFPLKVEKQLKTTR